MRAFRLTRLAWPLSAAILFVTSADAMEIRQFDKLANQDQSDYIGDLITGAEKVLNDEGKSDLAAQVKRLFTTKNPGDADVIGMVEFERNLAILRLYDAKNAKNTPMIRDLKSKM
jgi:predicted extracellular nuclease